MSCKSKPVDQEPYKGYVIQLNSFTWDAVFEVYKDGKLLSIHSDRSTARQWIDSQEVQNA